MSDLTEFLRARLDEDEAAAREAGGLTACWIADEPAIGVVLVDGEPLIEGHIGGLTAHIARNNPARVLREIVAKRAILDTLGALELDSPSFADLLKREMATTYSDHPDYRDEWKP